MSLRAPVVAGQSWGGNVVLDFAARWPEIMSGLVMVDGGFIDFIGAPGATWEQIAIDLKPPPLAGTPRVQMMDRMRGFHPDWDDEQLEMQMANFETMEDGDDPPLADAWTATWRSCAPSGTRSHRSSTSASPRPR